MRFTVFTHVPHTESRGKFFAYAPYVREMNVWLRNFSDIEVVAPKINDEFILGKEPYQKELIFTPIPLFDLLSFRNKVSTVFKLPLLLIRLFGSMSRADHIHIRCPGNVGLLACFCQIFFPKTPKTAKYAGNWDPHSKQPFTYRLQKWMLANTFLTRNIEVLAYGEWPGQSQNIRPFFTASFSIKEISEVKKKTFAEPFVFLFVGNLVKGKHPLEAIKMVQGIKSELNSRAYGRDKNILLNICGDGPERKEMEAYCRTEGIQQFVKFRGIRNLKQMKKEYQEAHFLILLSESEGWPKAVAEAMFFGCIPITTSIGCVPWILGNGSRGVVLTKPQKDYSEIIVLGVNETTALVLDNRKLNSMSESCKKWSQKFTLEFFEVALQNILRQLKTHKSGR